VYEEVKAIAVIKTTLFLYFSSELVLTFLIMEIIPPQTKARHTERIIRIGACTQLCNSHMNYWLGVSINSLMLYTLWL
jgi:hypothetical protein